jgi:hypothetical protein
MLQLSATRCSCITILWVSLVSFAAITFCVTSQQVFIVVSMYFVIHAVRADRLTTVGLRPNSLSRSEASITMSGSLALTFLSHERWEKKKQTAESREYESDWKEMRALNTQYQQVYATHRTHGWQTVLSLLDASGDAAVSLSDWTVTQKLLRVAQFQNAPKTLPYSSEW